MKNPLFNFDEMFGDMFKGLPWESPTLVRPTSTKPTCLNCKFSRERKELQDTLECRRKAPGSYPNVNFPNTGTHFPLMHGSNWCGEHEHKP